MERSELYFNLISDQYKIIRFITKTEHSEVYLVRHVLLDELRIAKIVNNQKVEHQRILQESRLIQSLKHPGIPIIYDIVFDSNSICIIEEYISGNSLTEFLNQEKNIGIRQICNIGIELCSILEYMHSFQERGILHLDLKPEHVIISQEGHVYLIDFDNAHYMDTESINYYGSVGFAAPEQYHRLFLNTTADIYSLGMLLLYMSNYGHSLLSLEYLHHKELFPIISRCLRHHMFQRYHSVKQIRKELQKLITSQHLFRNNHTHNVFIYGTKRGVGTTHSALLISSFLSRQGNKVICLEQGDRSDLRSEAEKGQRCKPGYFYYHGIYLLPNYDNHVDISLEKFDYRIYDCGVLEEQSPVDGYMIIISNVGFRVFDEIKQIEQLDPTIPILMNHISGDAFYTFLNQSNVNLMHSIYRIPCIYEWWSVNKLLEQSLKELFGDFYEENDNNKISVGKRLFGRLQMRNKRNSSFVKEQDDIHYNVKSISKPYIIGFIGIGKGAGTTHLSVMTGNYFANVWNKKVALVEWEEHNEYVHIQQQLEGNISSIMMFSFCNIDFYRKMNQERYSSLILGDYDFIILDLSYKQKAQYSEFLRSQKRFLVGQTDLWKNHELIRFLKENKELCQQVDGCMTLAYDRSVGLELEREYKIKMIPMPFERDPFYMKGENLSWFHENFM